MYQHKGGKQLRAELAESIYWTEHPGGHRLGDEPATERQDYFDKADAMMRTLDIFLNTQKTNVSDLVHMIADSLWERGEKNASKSLHDLAARITAMEMG